MLGRIIHQDPTQSLCRRDRWLEQDIVFLGTAPKYFSYKRNNFPRREPISARGFRPVNDYRNSSLTNTRSQHPKNKGKITKTRGAPEPPRCPGFFCCIIIACMARFCSTIGMQHSIPRFAGPNLCKAAEIDNSLSLTELKLGRNGPPGWGE